MHIFRSRQARADRQMGSEVPGETLVPPGDTGRRRQSHLIKCRSISQDHCYSYGFRMYIRGYQVPRGAPLSERPSSEISTLALWSLYMNPRPTM